MKMNKFDLERELKKMNEKLAKIKVKINKRLKKFQSKEFYRCDE
jgi:ABC-type Zn2+ transport system substrate-binding protein/surface adhesin